MTMKALQLFIHLMKCSAALHLGPVTIMTCFFNVRFLLYRLCNSVRGQKTGTCMTTQRQSGNRLIATLPKLSCYLKSSQTVKRKARRMFEVMQKVSQKRGAAGKQRQHRPSCAGTNAGWGLYTYCISAWTGN